MARRPRRGPRRRLGQLLRRARDGRAHSACPSTWRSSPTSASATSTSSRRGARADAGRLVQAPPAVLGRPRGDVRPPRPARRGAARPARRETAADIRPLDAKALGEALGAAEADDQAARLARHAGDHLRAARRALPACARRRSRSPRPSRSSPATTGCTPRASPRGRRRSPAQMVANFLGGGAVCNAFANQVGAEVCVVDVGVAADLPATPGLLPRKVGRGTADFTAGPAMTREEALAAIEVGIETARDLVAAGNKAPAHRRDGHRQHHRVRRPDLRVHRRRPGRGRPAAAPASTTRRTPARSTSSAAPSNSTSPTRPTRSASSPRSAAWSTPPWPASSSAARRCVRR